MLCKKPYRKGIMEYGCGQCMPCRINRSRTWIGRMLLESYEHPANSFITLTYAPEHMPKDGSLSKRAVQLFIKRLRFAVPYPIRFYAVGEYGDRTLRPHYHLLIFGLSPTDQKPILTSWPYGFVHIAPAEVGTMQYITGYITKRMTNPKDRRLGGRPPEFSLMSRRPGIGHGVVTRMAAAYLTPAGMAAKEKGQWIAERIRTQGHKYPLGRYLREKALDAAGFSEDQRKAHAIETLYHVASQKDLCTTTEYERQRKAKVEQQSTTRRLRKL